MHSKSVDLAQATAMYQEGATLRDIAAAQDVSWQTVGRRLHAAGIPLRGKAKTERQRAHLSTKRRKPLDEERLRKLRDQGMSTREIAAELRCSEECVRERMVSLGIPRLPAKARMERNVFWRGGRIVDKHGYILVKSPDHPHRTKAGYVREHRLVMEAMLGRYLEPREVVDHYPDPTTSNNDPNNLRLFASNKEHLRATLTGKIPNWSAQGEANILDGLQRGREKLAAIRLASETDAGH